MLKKPSPTRFAIKLHPDLKTALKYRALERGLDLSGYIQEVLWKECPEADNAFKSEVINGVAS